MTLLPFIYWVRSRLTSVGSILGLLLFYLVLPGTILYYVEGKVWSTSDGIFIMAFYLIYEVGYVMNDSVGEWLEKRRIGTSRKETRLDSRFIIFKIAINFTLVFLLNYYFGIDIKLISLQFAFFFFHNIVFGKLKLLSYLLLTFCRLSFPFGSWVGEEFLILFVLLSFWKAFLYSNKKEGIQNWVNFNGDAGLTLYFLTSIHLIVFSYLELKLLLISIPFIIAAAYYLFKNVLKDRWRNLKS